MIAPDHPGFGKSDEFPRLEAIDDFVFHYLDVSKRSDLFPAALPSIPRA